MTMISRMHIIVYILVIFVSQSNAQPDFRYSDCIDDNGNYTANSSYQNNLDTLLSNLVSNTQIDYGFYNFSYGDDDNRVNAIGLCRGDVKPDACRSCLNNSRVLLPKLCPNQKEAIGGYDECMLRYSNRSIFNTMETSPQFLLFDPDNATDVEKFNEVLDNLLSSLITNVSSSGNSMRKFDAASAAGPAFKTIFGLVQCTPDLTLQDCNRCLIEAKSEIPTCCYHKEGGRVVKPSCSVRFEVTPFYDTANVATPQAPAESPPPTESGTPSSPDASSNEGDNNTSRTVIAIVLPSIAFVIFVILICIYLWKRKPRKHSEVEAENGDEISPIETLQLDFATITIATDNFSDARKLGQGGFGSVYKGKLSDGQEVAVKRLSMNSIQGDTEFKNEVLLVAKLQHRNLVKLLGFCLERRERLLVYEFVPNKSLDFFIFDKIKRAQLNWERRYKIIKGIARGLVYLHEDSRLRIIHRDLKTSNILLDAEMNPKIADFGMARLVGIDQTQGNTSRIVGTYGYMAPEYAIHGHFSVKSDVFSFGVLVLEIVSGQKNNGVRQGEDVVDLVTFAWKTWREGAASSIIDPTITDGSRNEMMRCIHIALLCVQENVANRPTMASVVLMLNSYSTTLPLPSQPAYFTSFSNIDLGSQEYDPETSRSIKSNIQSVQASVNDDSITEPFARYLYK